MNYTGNEHTILPSIKVLLYREIALMSVLFLIKLNAFFRPYWNPKVSFCGIIYICHLVIHYFYPFFETRYMSINMKRVFVVKQNMTYFFNQICIVMKQTMYLLTEWEIRTGKYLAGGDEVRINDREPYIFTCDPK